MASISITAEPAHGFTDFGGTFSTVDNPLGDNFTQLLGLNNHSETAGYYQDINGVQFPFTELGGTFTSLDSLLPVNTSAQATGVKAIRGRLRGSSWTAREIATDS